MVVGENIFNRGFPFMETKEQSAQASDTMFGQYLDVLTHLPKYSKNIFRPDYFQWLWHQLHGWSKFSYTLLGANFILQIVILLQTLFSSPTETMVLSAILGFLGANLSVLCVCGISNRSGIQGWAGALSAIAIASSAFMAHNWANMWEQVIYLVFLDVFCILAPKWNENIVAESFKSKLEWIKYIAFFAVAWGAIYFVFSKTNDPNLFWDSITLALAFTGSLLELNRKTEQYVPWILGNFTAIMLWINTAQQGTANYAFVISYSIFALNSISGAIMWHNEAKANKKLAK